jgi:hypothetical protein
MGNAYRCTRIGNHRYIGAEGVQDAQLKRDVPQWEREIRLSARMSAEVRRAGMQEIPV